jgi:hypothetical protein
MKEKLKELAVKAQVEHCISHVRLEEFAELIVKDIMENLSFHGHEDAFSQVQWHAANKYGVKV